MKKKALSGQHGFSMIEVLVSTYIFLVIAALISINLLRAKQGVSLTSTLDVAISDIRSQQLKSMVGDTEGRATPDSYGIYFNTDHYTMFHGSAYSASDPTNVTIPLGDSIHVSTSFPNSIVVFNKGSGEVAGFVNGSDTITLSDTTDSNNHKTIDLNRLGVVEGIN